MDVTNDNIFFYEREKNVVFKNSYPKSEVLKRVNLQRALIQIKQAILKTTTTRKSSSVEVTSKIALAESYIKNGNYYEAEKIIRETAEVILPNPNLAKNTQTNKNFLAKVEKNNYQPGDLENEITNIRQSLDHAKNKGKINNNEINAKIMLAEAFIRSQKYTAAKEVIQEAADIVKGISIDACTYQKTAVAEKDHANIDLKNQNSDKLRLKNSNNHDHSDIESIIRSIS